MRVLSFSAIVLALTVTLAGGQDPVLIVVQRAAAYVADYQQKHRSAGQEADSIVGPVPLTAAQPWGTFQAMTHFRHTNLANMAFLDGHVETVVPVSVASDPSWPAGADAYRQVQRLGFPADNNVPYQGQ